MTVTNSTWLDFVIGFVVSLIGSVMNAAGVNLLKLDHVRNSSHPLERQRKDCGRPMWHLGLYLYVGSQLAGSTIALNFLKIQWVAPLGSIALIFNFIFAKILVGTRIVKRDVWGTIVVMISVIWIVVFGGMNSSGADVEETLTLPELKALFSRPVFIIYFSILNVVIAMFLSLGLYAFWVITMDDDSGQLRRHMKAQLTKLLGTNRFTRASGLTLESDNEGPRAEARDLWMKKVVAMIMSACGGLLASETLLLAKSGVRLISSSLNGHNQLQDSLSYCILCILFLTAILQVYCLNTALKIYDSVLVVPVFYGFYTAFGLINSIIYLNQLQNYQPWILVLILLGIGTLIFGVRMLSAPKPDPIPASEDEVEQLDDDQNDVLRKSGSGGTLPSSGSGITREKKLSKDDIEELGTTKLDEVYYPSSRRGTGTSSIATKVADSGLIAVASDDPGGDSRRNSMSQSLKATLHEKRASLDGASMDKRRQSIPKIDTDGAFTRGRSLTTKDSTARLSGIYPRPMSPSEFRAQYTNSPFPVKPKHLQERENSRRSSPIGSESGAVSPRRITGNAKIDQIFEDLNPFRVFRRGSLGDVSPGGISNASLTAFGGGAGPRRASTSSLPTSPSRAHSTDRYGRHTRQDSFTGRPSEWEEPNRRVRHSMLFGENGRSSSVGSRSSSRSASPAPSSARHPRHQTADLGSAFGTGSGGAWPGPTKNTSGASLPGGEENPMAQPHQHKHLSGHGHGSSSHYRSVSGSHFPQHGRQLSFTTKNDKVVLAAMDAQESKPKQEDDGKQATPSVSTLPISVQQQLQQLQQHQHYPTSSLQHSLTTSSISTIGSMVPSMSTASLAQFDGGGQETRS
ncbi:hypothetical protein BGZ74_009016 [Mortierella antarctica]|nr:hypothetical protein BGZ74_009016 [Mortierella antarctica]